MQKYEADCNTEVARNTAILDVGYNRAAVWFWQQRAEF